MRQAILGIDVSKARLEVMLLRPEQAPQAGGFDNTPAGHKRLGKWLKKRKAGKVHACLEATGLYGDEVALYLHQTGHTVSVVNPARIKAYAASQLARTKTDRVDAALIADFCRTQQPPAWEPPDPAWLELRAMVRHLTDLKDMRQQERNRLKAGVTSAVVEQTLQDHIAFLSRQIEDLDRRIQDHINRHPGLKQQRDLLTSIPGIGDTSAGQLLAEVRDFQAFASARQLVAYAGLNPRHRRSGSSVRGRSRLSKTGNAALRRALYCPALCARQHNPILKAFADQLAARGIPKMAVIAAVMRKLLHLAFGILKSGQPFDPHFRVEHGILP